MTPPRMKWANRFLRSRLTILAAVWKDGANWYAGMWPHHNQNAYTKVLGPYRSEHAAKVNATLWLKVGEE